MISQQDKNNNFGESNASSEDFAYNIFKTLDIIKLKRIGCFFNRIKRCGVDVSDILMVLVLMPFHQVSTVASLVKNGFEGSSTNDCGKDVYYDLKNNVRINWRSLLWLVSLRFNELSTARISNSDKKNKVRALIADDSLLPKTGEKTEFISRVHDHVSGKFVFGYKLLVLGYWDGESFYPLDFSLHREKGSQVCKVKEKLTKAKKKQIVLKKILDKLIKKQTDVHSALSDIRQKNKGKASKSAMRKIVNMENKKGNAKKKVSAAKRALSKIGNDIVILRAELKIVQVKYPDYGLSAKKRKNQFTKIRQAGCPGAKRAGEVDTKKLTA